VQDLVAYFRGLDEGVRLAVMTSLRVALILVIAWVLQAIAARLIRMFHHVMQRRIGAGDQVARIQTLARVFRNIAAVVIVLVAGMLILGELGISVAPILATAGVAGIAIGFGAQSLIKDYFNGVFLLLDDQIREGDVVNIAGLGGFVEQVTLRYVRLRNFDGHVHYVPNGEIKVVTNMTREFATTVIEVGVAYREDPDEALGVMREVAAEMCSEPAWQERMVGEIEIIGVERWADSAVILRARLRVVPPIQQWNVKREFLKRLKKAYDARGIEIPYPHLTIYAGQAKDGSAPPFQILEKTPSKTA
jgi:small conductance mechanosensitive channel